MKWRVDTGGRFYAPGENFVVYFDPASGDTHLVNEFAAYLIDTIARKPMDTDQLISDISADLHPDDLSEFSAKVPQVLSELASLDIIKLC